MDERNTTEQTVSYNPVYVREDLVRQLVPIVIGHNYSADYLIEYAKKLEAYILEG